MNREQSARKARLARRRRERAKRERIQQVVIRFRVEGVEEVVASLKRMAAAAKVASTEIARLGRAWRAVKRAAASRTRG